MHAELTRRFFLKMACGTVTLTVTPAASLLASSQAGQSPPESNTWMGPPGEASYRIDGLPKVLGEKIFARDFRSRDLPGWPREPENVAIVLRAVHADRPMLGYDLSSLPSELQPSVIVDAAILKNDFVQDLWWDSPNGLMVAENSNALYYGQPVAILIFSDYEVYRKASRLLQFNPQIIQYGPPSPSPTSEEPYSPPTYLTLYQRTTNGQSSVEFSQVKNGVTNPYATGSSLTDQDKEARRVRAQIEQEISDQGSQGAWRTFSGTRSTQLIVPMFMEPESGLGWYDREAQTLNILLGTQSPDGDIQDAMELFDDPMCPVKISKVNLISCYPGGGFGGRDTSPFVPIMILAAAYAGGPVRIARDRFQEFQSGLTQLQSHIEQTLAVDGQGNFQALRTVSRLPSGGKNNYSQYVAELAGYTAGGGYLLPRGIVDATAQPTRGLVAGSMRGFGGPQAAFALETLIDEVAEKLQRDPIDLRRQNALEMGDRTITGAPLTEPMRIVEICEKAARNPLWTQRERVKSEQARSSLLYGVGFALANQAYGTGSDGVMADVSIGRDGAVKVQTNAVDMGNGPATTLAIATARWLGSNATAIEMGQVAVFRQLRLTNKINGKRPAKHPWAHPHYTASFSMSSSACLTAFHQVHAVHEASRVLFRLGLWPAATSLWGSDPGEEGLRAARWEEGRLVAPGHPPLDRKDIVARLYSQEGICEAIVHAYFSGRWVSSSYNVNGIEGHWPIDGLTTRTAGAEGYQWHGRFNVVPPPPNSHLYGRSLYAPSGAIASVLVDPQSGEIKVHDVHTYLDAGKVQQPDLLSGQYEGGVAMGVGYALLENLPPGPQGGGDGTWNLNRYHVALAGDLPLDRIHLEVLPTEAPTGKGIAEAVLCPLPPAIANAVAHATGKRFNSLPITPAQVREALGEDG